MNRRKFINSLSLGLTTFTLSSLFSRSCFRSVTSKQEPNIVLIYADDLGYGDISCYGGYLSLRMGDWKYIAPGE